MEETGEENEDKDEEEEMKKSKVFYVLSTIIQSCHDKTERRMEQD